MTPLRALSIRQPWAHAIVHLGKDVENRGRLHPHRGPVLIHASAGMTDDEWIDAGRFIDDVRARLGLGKRLPLRQNIERGGIVGIATMTDAVHQSDSPWWMGPCGFTLRDARPLPFIPCRGTVTPLFWLPDDAVQAKVAAALRA